MTLKWENGHVRTCQRRGRTVSKHGMPRTGLHTVVMVMVPKVATMVIVTIVVMAMLVSKQKKIADPVCRQALTSSAR